MMRINKAPHPRRSGESPAPGSVEIGKRSLERRAIRTVRLLTYMIVTLMAVSSVAGLWIPALYRDEPATAAVFRGYELTLVVVPYTLAAVLIWRRAAWGFVAATVLLVSGLVTQLSYTAGLVFQEQAEVPGATAFDVVEPVIVAVYVIALVLLLANLPVGARVASAVSREFG